MYNVIAYYNTSKDVIFSGTLEECKFFIEFNNGSYLDENDFYWNLGIEEENII